MKEYGEDYKRLQQLLTAIDIVNFPANKEVILAHTQTEFGAGCIKLPDGSGIAVWLISPMDLREGGVNRVKAIKQRPFVEAFSTALLQVKEWLAVRGKRLEDIEATHAIKNAPLNVDQFQYMDGNKFERQAQHFAWIIKMTKFQQSSVSLSIPQIVGKLIDSR